MSYVTADQIANSLMQGQGTGTSLTSTEVTDVEAKISAVTEQIDKRCGWAFTDDGESTRTFVSSDHSTLTLPPFCPLREVTAIEVDTDGDGTYATSWDLNDVQLGPVSAEFNGRPYEYLTAVGSGTWPVGRRRSVRITGTWGWAATPAVVVEATTLQVSRLWHRRHSPDGIAGLTPEGGVSFIVRIDPDVAMLLKGVSRTKTKIASARLTA